MTIGIRDTRKFDAKYNIKAIPLSSEITVRQLPSSENESGTAIIPHLVATMP